MSFGTTYLTPSAINRDSDFNGPRHSRHSYPDNANEMFVTPKLESDPRDFYTDDNREMSSEPNYMVDHPMGMDGQRHPGGPGAKQPRDRMRLNRILNGSSSSSSEEVYQQQQQQQHQDGESSYGHYPYQDSAPSHQFQSFHPSVGTMPESSFPSPMAVPVATLPTLATMSSPSASFSPMNQSNLIFDNVMPYSYNNAPYPPQNYPFKHAGNAKSMEPSSFGDHPGYSHPSHQHYQHSPDPSGSPSVLSALPPRMNPDSHGGVPDSPPSSFYHGQHQAPSPYSIGSHSPTSSAYPPAYVSAGPQGYNSLTPTPPATPHYGFAHTPDGRYAGGPGMPVYGDYFTLQSGSSSAGGPRQNNRYLGSPSTPPTPTPTARPRKTPYQPRAARTTELGAAGATPAPRRFPCQECEKAFPTKGELASHSRCHLKVPAFLCGICGRPFKRRTDYVRHVRNVHEEVGRYSCIQCGERFGRLDKLKRHDKRGCGADPEDDDK
ncbi:hypothetical protein EC957_001508 [Mortierella hygrophila]|uniref:C2H2-type domain-containing protein n=1 Tax=Mortierella hygrophila TaxID=979708 RepID=A0A9P6K297_9FUNG|nr:hypothetical protein BGX30_001754 [Mortierella sp. GBA39]KAF9542853.1 hypothetical protein EC957_001508 [Mortierella hygrophila]